MADIVMSDNTTNVTSERLDMALDDIIKEKNTKTKEARKKNTIRKRNPVNRRVPATRTTTRNTNAIRQRAVREDARTQILNRARGITVNSSPSIMQRNTAANRRARLISRRAVQRRQNPAPTVTSTVGRRRRTMNTQANTNLKVTFTNTNTNSNMNTNMNMNTNRNTNRNANSIRNAGLQGTRMRRIPVRNTRVGRSPRSSFGAPRVISRPPIRRLTVKNLSRQENQQRNNRMVAFNQSRNSLRDRQVLQMRGIQQTRNTAAKKLTLNERFSNESSSSNNHNNNNNNNGNNNGNNFRRSSQARERGRGMFQFQQPPQFNNNYNNNNGNNFGRSRRQRNRRDFGNEQFDW